jgi:Cu2+-exporting ATPase
MIDIMLFGNWMEMRSIVGASRDLVKLAKLLPITAHKVLPDGSSENVLLEDLEPGDRVLVEPG